MAAGSSPSRSSVSPSTPNSRGSHRQKYPEHPHRRDRRDPGRTLTVRGGQENPYDAIDARRRSHGCPYSVTGDARQSRAIVRGTVAEADTAQDALRLADQHRPDVTIMDLFLRGESGVSATRELCRRQRGARVLILTAIDNPSFIREAFAAGARGYALKRNRARKRSSTPCAWSAAAALTALALRSRPDGGREAGRATRRAVRSAVGREREIFDLVVAGHGNQRIAAELFISIKTVETHRAASTASWAALRRRARPVRRPARPAVSGFVEIWQARDPA